MNGLRALLKFARLSQYVAYSPNFSMTFFSHDLAGSSSGLGKHLSIDAVLSQTLPKTASSITEVSSCIVADKMLALINALAASRASRGLDLLQASSSKIRCLSSVCVGSVESSTHWNSRASRGIDDGMLLHRIQNLTPSVHMKNAVHYRAYDTRLYWSAQSANCDIKTIWSRIMIRINDQCKSRNQKLRSRGNQRDDPRPSGNGGH